MLKQRRFIINYIINNQPESIDIQTDAETISDDDAQAYINKSRDEETPANVTEIRIIGVQPPVDAEPLDQALDAEIDHQS